MKALQRSINIFVTSRLQWNIRSYSQSVESRLQIAEEEYLGDTHLRILSSPLRRCQATMMVLPKLIMFKMVPQQNVDQSPSSLMKELKEEEDALRANKETKNDRWFKRQAKVMLAKRLKDETNMLKHKIVTSQTDDSKKKFEIELKEKNKQVELVYGYRTPKNLTYTVEGIESNQFRLGSARWCLLDAKAALILLGKRNFRYSQKNIKPDEFLSVISETLEKDVLHTVEYLSTLSAKDEWLIRQTDQEKNELSAIVQTNLSADAINNDTPTYNIDHLFNERNDVKDKAIHAMQSIAEDTSSNPDTFLIRKHQLTTSFCVALWRLNQWRQSLTQT